MIHENTVYWSAGLFIGFSIGWLSCWARSRNKIRRSQIEERGTRDTDSAT